uniref:Apple domain-containing protein n=1 Tax=Syphacia muris TaxID=451379 RepID=A0A0N5AKP3_9BILA
MAKHFRGTYPGNVRKLPNDGYWNKVIVDGIQKYLIKETHSSGENETGQNPGSRSGEKQSPDRSSPLDFDEPSSCFDAVPNQSLLKAGFEMHKNMSLDACRCACINTWLTRNSKLLCRSFQYNKFNECLLNKADHHSKFDLVYDFTAQYYYINCTATELHKKLVGSYASCNAYSDTATILNSDGNNNFTHTFGTMFLMPKPNIPEYLISETLSRIKAQILAKKTVTTKKSNYELFTAIPQSEKQTTTTTTTTSTSTTKPMFSVNPNKKLSTESENKSVTEIQNNSNNSEASTEVSSEESSTENTEQISTSTTAGITVKSMSKINGSTTNSMIDETANENNSPNENYTEIIHINSSRTMMTISSKNPEKTTTMPEQIKKASDGSGSNSLTSVSSNITDELVAVTEASKTNIGEFTESSHFTVVNSLTTQQEFTDQVTLETSTQQILKQVTSNPELTTTATTVKTTTNNGTRKADSKHFNKLVKIASENDKKKKKATKKLIKTNKSEQNSNTSKVLASEATNRNRSCFEVIDGYAMKGTAGGLEHNVTVEQCMCICANNRISGNFDFQCKSATYYHNEKDCVLNLENRKQRPELYGKNENKEYSVSYIGLTCSTG